MNISLSLCMEIVIFLEKKTFFENKLNEYLPRIYFFGQSFTHQNSLKLEKS